MRNAQPVPLTEQVRVDLDTAIGKVDEIRASLPPHFARASDQPDTVALLDQLEEFVRSAPKIPLTDQVRIDRERAYDLVDLLAATLSTEASQLLWKETGPEGVRAAELASAALVEGSATTGRSKVLLSRRRFEALAGRVSEAVRACLGSTV